MVATETGREAFACGLALERIMARTDTAHPRTASPVKISEGAIGGLIAGVVYTLFVEAVNLSLNGPDAFFVPFRQIGAVVLGPAALEPSYDLVTATAAGVGVHFVLSAVLGIVFAALMRALNVTASLVLVVLGIAYGLAVYALDFFVIFPSAFPWFLANDPLIQSIGHGIFGGTLGWWLAARR